MNINAWVRGIASLLTFILLVGCAPHSVSKEKVKPTLFLVGDSTMADQPREKYPEQGWGQALPAYLKETTEVQNHARNGRSTKSFIDEGRWQAVLDRLQSGDFVVLGFGHNDQKDYDEARYAAPWTDYRANLERILEDIRSAGGRFW